MKPQEVRELLEQGEIIQALHAAPLWKYFAIHRTPSNSKTPSGSPIRGRVD